MKKIEVEIEGTNTLIMNRFGELAIEGYLQKTKKTQREFDTKEMIEDKLYRKENGELFIPSKAIKTALLIASSFYKLGKKSLKPFIAGLVRIEPIEIGLGTKKYETKMFIDNLKGMKKPSIKPFLKTWKAKFNLFYDEPLDEEKLKEVLTEAGFRCGLLEYRPQRNGEFGTFKITKWVVANVS